jgi:hypothetical protein
LLTRMARSAHALTACEPVVDLTWGELTPACVTACAPLAAPRASRGGGHPGPDSAGPEDRTIGPDHRIISRLARGQSFVRHIERDSSDAIAKGWGTVRPREQRPGPESKGRTPPREARLREATRKRRAIRRPGMPRKQELRGRGVTSRDKARTAPEILGPNAGQLRPELPRRLIRCIPLHFFLSLTRQGPSLRLHLPFR